MNTIIKDGVATLSLKPSIPLHYYEFFEYLETTYGFDTKNLEEMACSGIIAELNLIHESLDDAIAIGKPTIKPDLSIGTKIFKEVTK